MNTNNNFVCKKKYRFNQKHDYEMNVVDNEFVLKLIIFFDFVIDDVQQMFVFRKRI